MAVVLTGMATLHAGEKTSLVASEGGNILLLQPDAQRRLMVMDGGGSLSESSLSPARMMAMLGATGGPIADGKISVRAVAALGGGKLVVYAAGTARRRSLVSLWLYQPGRDVLTLAADSKALGDASGMGDSIDLADAQFVQTSRGVWLCLYHSDAAVFFLLPGDLLAPNVRLRRAFSQLRQDGRPLRFLADDRLFARADGGLGLLRGDGAVCSIGEEGNVFDIPRIAGRPAWSAPPLSLPSDPGAPVKTRLEFYPNDLAAGDALAAPPTEADTPPRYPAFAIAGAQSTRTIDRESITIRPGFPVHALRITAWCLDPGSGDAIAYDSMSGEIMRIGLPRNDG